MISKALKAKLRSERLAARDAISSEDRIEKGLAMAEAGGSQSHPVVLMHNDAVVQGLSELPWMQDVKHWAVMTIGTGLGNAHFTNRAQPDDAEE